MSELNETSTKAEPQAGSAAKKTRRSVPIGGIGYTALMAVALLALVIVIVSVASNFSGLGELEGRRTATQAQVDLLTDQIVDIRTQIEGMSEQEVELKKLLGRIETAQQKEANLLGKNVELANQNKELDVALTGKKVELEVAVRSFDEAKRDTQRTQETLEGLHEDKRSLSDEIGELTQKVTSDERRYDDAREAFSQEQGRLGTLRSEIEDLSDEKTALNKAVETLRQDKEKVRGELKGLEGQVLAEEEHLSTLKSRAEGVKESSSVDRKRMENIRGELETVQRELKRLETDLNAEQSELKVLLSKREQLVAEVGNLSRLQQDKVRVTEEITQLLEDRGKQDSNLAGVREQLSRLMEEMKSRQNERDIALSTTTTLRDEKGALESDLVSLTARQQVVDAALSSASSKLATESAKLLSIVSQLSDARSQESQLKTTIGVLEAKQAEIKIDEDRFQFLNENIPKLAITRDELDQEIQVLNRKKLDLEGALEQDSDN